MTPSSGNPPLARSVVWRFGSTVARSAVALVSVPIFTRLLGIEQWGLLALIQAATAPLVLLDLGFTAATVKYVSEALGRDERATAVRVVHTSVCFNAAVGLAGAAGLMACAGWLAGSVFAIPAAEVPRAITGFRIIAISWLAGTITAAHTAVIAAFQRYDVMARLGTLSMLASTVAGLAAARLGGDVVAVVGAQTLVTVLTSVVYVMTASKLLPGSGAWPRWDPVTLRRSFSFGGWQTLAMLGGVLSGWADRCILGAFFAPTMVGFYAVAHLLYARLYGSFYELSDVLVPAVSHRQGRASLADARRLALLAGWTLTSVFGACAVVLATVGGDFLHLWISPEAALASSATLRLLCIAGVIGISALAPLQYMQGIGAPRWNAASSLALGGTVLATGLVLVPWMGLRGVGYGLIAGVTVRWLFVAVIGRRHFGVDIALRQFAAEVWAPPITSALLLVALTRVHDAIGRSPTWQWLAVATVGTSFLAALLQFGVGELLPGGAARRRAVVNSFLPLARSWTQTGESAS